MSFLQRRQAPQTQISGAVAHMCNQRHVAQLRVAQRSHVSHIADVDHIGFEQLIQGLGRIPINHSRRDGPMLDVGKAVRHEALCAQL